MKYQLIGLLVSIGLFTNVEAVDMRLNSIDGTIINLGDYRGSWVVVNYWATWCPPCIEEMPELQAFHDANADKGAIVIGINMENIGKQRLLAFVDDYFITYPIFTTTPVQESELGLIPGIPTTFLVSPESKVVARQIGPITRELIEKFIHKWESQ